MLSENTFISAMKAVAWEEAKGKLRALGQLDGARQYDSHYPSDKQPRYKIVEERVERFIREFEDDGLHE